MEIATKLFMSTVQHIDYKYFKVSKTIFVNLLEDCIVALPHNAPIYENLCDIVELLKSEMPND